MTERQNSDPLHGITLENLLTQLVERYGWTGLADLIRINCFSSDPSIKSSLKFLRKTPWARKEVEALYIGGESGLLDYKRKNRTTATAKTNDNPTEKCDSKPQKRSVNDQQTGSAANNPWLNSERWRGK